MFSLDQFPELRARINDQVALDRHLLDEVLAQAKPLASQVRTIHPRSATSVALMAADGGNNRVAFNPFHLQIIRIVDSAGRELAFDVVSPTTDTAALNARHIAPGRVATTALGRLMNKLEVSGLHELSRMIPLDKKSHSWVLVYRDLCEWATLYELITNSNFASDTLIVRDGLLRSKIFAEDYFIQMHRIMRDAIEEVRRNHKRNVWLVGLAKHTEVLDYYRLGLSLAGVMDTGTPCFVPVPMDMQKKVYRWTEYIRDPDHASASTEDPKYNAGAMHFVRFGNRASDPIWTVDLLYHQADQAQQILGYLLADSAAGFPVPFYPLSLQQADAHSRVADLDMDIIEDNLVDAIRSTVGPDLAPVIDGLRLATDVAARRYE